MKKYYIFLILLINFLFLFIINNSAAQNLTNSAIQNQTSTPEVALQQRSSFVTSQVFGDLIEVRQAIQKNNNIDAYRALNSLEQQLLNERPSFETLTFVNQVRQALQNKNNFDAYRALNSLEQQLLDSYGKIPGGGGKSSICDSFQC